eukprot:s3239_g4.t1
MLPGWVPVAQFIAAHTWCPCLHAWGSKKIVCLFLFGLHFHAFPECNLNNEWKVYHPQPIRRMCSKVFISYENGKTAVSVKHAVKCLSVCMWEARPQLEEGKGKEPDGSTCTWQRAQHGTGHGYLGR